MRIENPHRPERKTVTRRLAVFLGLLTFESGNSAYFCVYVYRRLRNSANFHGRQSWGGWGGGRVPPSFWRGGGRISNYPPPPTF
jgi:hypothetical protein